MKEFHTGYVSIIGRPNVGKSTLLNCLIEQKLSIVSRKPQTTRWSLLGIKTTENSQIIFIDTPGLQKEPKLALNQHMNKEVTNTLGHIDIILFVVEALKWNELDDNVLSLLVRSPEAQIILVLNKIDKVTDKQDLLAYIAELSKNIKYKDIIPVSASKNEGIGQLETAIIKALPESPALFPEDQITDRNERFFAAEFIREKLMMRLSDELPYHLSITIDEFKEKNNVLHIFASIWVERKGQKSIVIGKEGNVLKLVGKEARIDMEEMFAKKVNLKTWVKVKKKWTDSEYALKQFGYYD